VVLAESASWAADRIRGRAEEQDEQGSEGG